jgi:cobalt/nickel transport system permease protein
MKNKIPAFLLSEPSQAQSLHERGQLRASSIEKGMKYLSEMITAGFMNIGQETVKGLFQNLDARLKVVFLVFFVVIVSLKRELFPEVIIALFMALMVALSRMDFLRFYRKILGLTFFFGFLVVFPAAFNVITPGEMILPVATLPREYDFWIYHIPREIGLTRQGIEGVIMLCLRVMNSLAISLLVIHTTPFHKIIKALQVFRVPDTFLLIITLSYKYIFVFAKTVENMYLARKSRLVGMVKNDEDRMWIAGRMVFLFRKTMARYEEVFMAMAARGFCEEIKLSEFGALNRMDRLFGSLFLLVGIVFLWM